MHYDLEEIVDQELYSRVLGEEPLENLRKFPISATQARPRTPQDGGQKAFSMIRRQLSHCPTFVRLHVEIRKKQCNKEIHTCLVKTKDPQSSAALQQPQGFRKIYYQIKLTTVFDFLDEKSLRIYHSSVAYPDRALKHHLKQTPWSHIADSFKVCINFYAQNLRRNLYKCKVSYLQSFSDLGGLSKMAKMQQLHLGNGNYIGAASLLR